MVSRGIARPDILKGIHLSMASRIVKLLKVTGVKDGVALLTGGLSGPGLAIDPLACRHGRGRMPVALRPPPDRVAQNNQSLSMQKTAATSAVAGIVRTQASRILPARPQRTVEALRTEPTP